MKLIRKMFLPLLLATNRVDDLAVHYRCGVSTLAFVTISVSTSEHLVGNCED